MKKRLMIVTGLICWMAFGCDNPRRPGTAEAWQNSMCEGLVPGYINFTAHSLDSDIEAYIFSYTCSVSIAGEELFTLLQKQIHNFHLNSQTEATLVLRRLLSYSVHGGFDEWRFMYDKETRVMTVLFANLDSEVERKAHSSIVNKLKKYQDEEVGKRKKALNQTLHRLADKPGSR
jgi:hypothetical protein